MSVVWRWFRGRGVSVDVGFEFLGDYDRLEILFVMLLAGFGL